MRGAVELPGGIVARIGLAIETRVDGRLALRTQVSTETPGVQVFAGGPPMPAGGMTIVAGQGRPDIRIERNNAGTTVAVIPAAAPTTLRLGAAADMAPADTALPVTPNGPGVQTALGTVTLSQDAGGIVAQLSGADLAVRQFVGAGTGSIVVNTADNRVIDTATTLNLELQGQALPGNIAGALNGLFGAIR